MECGELRAQRVLRTAVKKPDRGPECSGLADPFFPSPRRLPSLLRHAALLAMSDCRCCPPTEFVQSLHNRSDIATPRRTRGRAQDPDGRQLRRLLRARRERPRGCRTAEQRDELATPDASCHLIPPAEGWCGPTIAQSVATFPKTRRAFRFRPRSLFSPNAAAYPPGRFHGAVPSRKDRQVALRRNLWLHEIKHDGFRVIARKDGTRVRLYTRPGNDFTPRFPLIAEALARLRSRSCIIDGEAVACDDNGLASFERIRYRQHDRNVFLYAFDLIELN